MKLKLTPDFVRQVADTLGDEPYGVDSYICIIAKYSIAPWCLVGGGGAKMGQMLQDLMQECGIEELNGELFTDAEPGFYTEHAMPVRFMFLEFIAHYLEGET